MRRGAVVPIVYEVLATQLRKNASIVTGPANPDGEKIKKLCDLNHDSRNNLRQQMKPSNGALDEIAAGASVRARPSRQAVPTEFQSTYMEQVTTNMKTVFGSRDLTISFYYGYYKSGEPAPQ